MSFHLVPPPKSKNDTKENSNERIPKKPSVTTSIKINGNPRPKLRTTKSTASSVSSLSDYTPGADNRNKHGTKGAVNAEELSKSLLGLKKSSSSLSLQLIRKKKNSNDSTGSYTPISPRTNRKNGIEYADRSSGKTSPVLNRSSSSSINNLRMSDSLAASPSQNTLNSLNQNHPLSTRASTLEYLHRRIDSSPQEQGSHSNRNSLDSSRGRTGIEAFNFKPIIDLSIMNTYDSMKKHLYFPTFQVLKYNNFLNILSDYHPNDPISFANVRHHSLVNFIICYKPNEQLAERLDYKQHDIRFYETLLGYELLKSRSIFRHLIRVDSAKVPNKSKIINCEELIQLNLTNYVRFVLTLPDELPVPLEQLDSIQRTHYRYKKLFKEIGNILYLMNKESGGDENPEAGNTYVLQTIRKVSYEYILLEEYLIQIFAKIGDNSLIESRNLKGLFDKFVEKQLSKISESVKVLHYNAYFSAQYSWYLAISAPFIRLFEMNSYSENSSMVNDSMQYNRNMEETKQTSFKDLDQKLYDYYFKHLGLDDYSKYRSLTPEKLVTLHKTISKLSQKLQKTEDLESGSYGPKYKPMNFEYYTESLSTISSETFDLIQTRDLAFQLTPNNYHVILREFYRILKTGGVLELPFIQLSRSKMRGAFQEQHDFSKDHGLLDLNLLEQFNMIPDIVQVTLKELAIIFGKENVKFNMSLLNSIEELNSFMGKHVCFQIFEMFGRLDDYCTKFCNGDDGNVLDINQDGLYYYIYIKAHKK